MREERQHTTALLALTLVACLAPRVAMANVGVPMLGLFLPMLVLLLVPILIIEVAYLSRHLPVGWKLVVKPVLVANLASSFIGIPMTWIVLLALQWQFIGGTVFGISTFSGKLVAVTWQAPWLIPYRDSLHWMIPAAGLVLLVPFFFITWWSEYLIVRWFLPEADRAALWRIVRNANLLSYALLAATLLLLPFLIRFG
jgi:hypothetical protein